MLMYNRSGVAIAVGTVGRDPTVKKTSGGKTLTEFFVNYGAPTPSENGEREYKSIWVKVWNAEQGHGLTPAQFIEKGDKVAVFGACVKNEYMSEKKGKETFEIIAEMIIPAALVDSMTASLVNGDSKAPAPQFEDRTDIDDGELPY